MTLAFNSLMVSVAGMGMGALLRATSPTSTCSSAGPGPGAGGEPMLEHLSSALQIATVVYAAASMLLVGLSYTLRQIVAPLRHGRSVATALLANIVAVPLLALVVVRVLSLETPLAIGLLLVATATGAPFLIQLTHMARGDVRLAAGLLVLQLVASMVYMPIVVPLLAPEARVDALAIASPLVLTMLLPLGLGLFLGRWNRPLARRLRPVLKPVSLVALATLVVATFWLHLPAVGGVFGSGAIRGALAVVVGAFVIGHLLAGADARKRKVLALGTAQRGLAAATVVATQAFDDPKVVVMVVVTMLVSMAVLFPLAWALGRRAARGPALKVTFLEERRAARHQEPRV